tara:strand:- start:1945 stop:2337 length:393 start_codon:yes stop_codon:yes gene_type:complete
MKTIHDELEIYQECDGVSRSVHIYLDDDGETQIDLEFIINDEGKYQLRWMCGGESFSPSYFFSKVSEHVRVTQVSEHCNMIPPDFELHDPIGMTPTEPNEGFRHCGVKDFESKYEWSREKQDWVIKEVVE